VNPGGKRKWLVYNSTVSAEQSMAGFVTREVRKPRRAAGDKLTCLGRSLGTLGHIVSWNEK
jgi:hypothetical protein